MTATNRTVAIGKTQIHMRLDVSFADVITPHLVEFEIPTIFAHMGKLCIRAYITETVIA